MLLKGHNEELRQRSGEFNSDDPITSFLYTLMRDHCIPGIIEGIVRELEDSNGTAVFTNGWMAQYAEDLAKRIRQCEVTIDENEPV